MWASNSTSEESVCVAVGHSAAGYDFSATHCQSLEPDTPDPDTEPVGDAIASQSEDASELLEGPREQATEAKSEAMRSEGEIRATINDPPSVPADPAHADDAAAGLQADAGEFLGGTIAEVEARQSALGGAVNLHAEGGVKGLDEALPLSIAEPEGAGGMALEAELAPAGSRVDIDPAIRSGGSSGARLALTTDLPAERAASAMPLGGGDADPARSDPGAGLSIAVAFGSAAALAGYALYTRLARDRELDHPVRSQLYARVRTARGVTAAELSRELGSHITTVLYHLRRLKGAGLLTSHESDAATYWTTPEVRPEIGVLEATRRPVAQHLAEAVSAQPGSTAPELASRIMADVRLARYHLHRLEHAGLVKRAELDRATVWMPAEAAVSPA